MSLLYVFSINMLIVWMNVVLWYIVFMNLNTILNWKLGIIVFFGAGEGVTVSSMLTFFRTTLPWNSLAAS